MDKKITEDYMQILSDNWKQTIIKFIQRKSKVNLVKCKIDAYSALPTSKASKFSLMGLSSVTMVMLQSSLLG